MANPACLLACLMGMNPRPPPQRGVPMSAQGIALGTVVSSYRSIKGAALIPHVALIDFDVVPFAEFSELVLKRHFLVMFLLIFNVFSNLRNV